jgi:serine/threonine protein phosphatase 1
MIELGLSDERRKATFRIPEGVSIYAIGDVHGRSDLLDRLFSRIDDDLVANPVPRPIHVFLGDYIDRGPDSYGVLDRLIQRAETHEAVFLKGNRYFCINFFASLQPWRNGANMVVWTR